MKPEELEYLEESLVYARAQVPGRLLMDVAVAGCFASFVGWLFAGVWLAVAFIVFDVAGPRLVRRDPASPRARYWGSLAILYAGLGPAVVGAIGVAAGLRGGIWGLIGGEFLLFSLALLATFTARRSAVAYNAAIAAPTAYLILLDGLSFTLTADLIGPIVLCVGTIAMLVQTQSFSTANRRLAIEKEEALTSAEAATAAKSAFVAMVSHELRTPISGILAGAAELAAAASDATSRKNAALVTQAARMMRTLLNDLLDLSKIEAGRMGVEIIAFDLRATILETIQFWGPELRRKQLYFRIKGARRLPRWVKGDATRLRQILNNLFSNSAKFTSVGGLILDLNVLRADAGPVRVAIELTDTGPGMTGEQVGRLFSAFEQLGESTARVHGGTGLGLHISRELARLMGGDITVRSTPGAGSTFRTELSLTPCEPPAPTMAPTPTVDLLGLRVLIVDDHHVNRHAFSLMLQAITTHVASAEDGQQALDLLAIEEFDLVLMDVHMPNLDGLEATKRLRSTPGPNQNTPVVALSGSVSPSQIDFYRAAGMNAFVMKPVTPAELLAAIDQLFSTELPAVDTLPTFDSQAAVAS